MFKKLDNFGVRGLPLKLFKSYLSNRTQTVFCNSKLSSEKCINTGVPQGSILGPILFLIYINDIVNSSDNFKFTIYADDTTLLLADKNIHSLYLNLCTEIPKINNWIKSNRLKLNVSKTNYIFFFKTDPLKIISHQFY